VVAATVIVVGAGVAAYATTRSTKEPRLAAATVGAARKAQPRPGSVSTAGAQYLGVVGSGNAVRADLAQFLAGAPSITPRSEIDRRIAVYTAAAGKADDALSATRWPGAIAPHVQELVAADRALTSDLELGAGLLNLSWFADKLQSDAARVHLAANEVRHGLRLRPVAPLDDARFSLI
jgi:hypothetical protein